VPDDRFVNVVAYLKDGRSVDLSELTPREAVELLQQIGVSHVDVDRIEHRSPFPLAELLRRAAARYAKQDQ
jgi:hypothetical protein